MLKVVIFQALYFVLLYIVTPRKSVVTTRRLAHDRTSSTETDGSKNESKSLPVDQNNPFQRTALVTIIIIVVLSSVPKCVCVCVVSSPATHALNEQEGIW